MFKMILLFLILVIVILYVSQRQEQKPKIITQVKYLPPIVQKAIVHPEPEVELPLKADLKNRGPEYLDVVQDSIFTEGQRESHCRYTDLRREAGDFTLQLWGVNDAVRGYASNYNGPRRPRQIKIDPYSPIQPGTSDLKDYVNPNDIRMI